MIEQHNKKRAKTKIGRQKTIRSTEAENRKSKTSCKWQRELKKSTHVEQL